MSGPARAGCSSGPELTAAHITPSACLPMLFQAVEIEGEPFWDGGYAGNPALYPLFYNVESDDNSRGYRYQPDRANSTRLATEARCL